MYYIRIYNEGLSGRMDLVYKKFDFGEKAQLYIRFSDPLVEFSL